MLDKEKQVVDLLENHADWDYEKVGKEERFRAKVYGSVINNSHIITFITTDLDSSVCKIELFIDSALCVIRNEFTCNLANLLQNKRLEIEKAKYESTYDDLIYMLSPKF